MASLHAWRGGDLPEKRERLYADAVELLLNLWEQRRIQRDVQGQPVLIQLSLAEYLKIDRTKVRGMLETLAFEAHQSPTVCRQGGRTRPCHHVGAHGDRSTPRLRRSRVVGR